MPPNDARLQDELMHLSAHHNESAGNSMDLELQRVDMDSSSKTLRAFRLCTAMFGFLVAGPAVAEGVAASNIAYTYNAKGIRLWFQGNGLTEDSRFSLRK